MISAHAQRKLEVPTFCLVTSLLSHLAAEPDGTAHLLRGGATGATSGGPGGEAFIMVRALFVTNFCQYS